MKAIILAGGQGTRIKAMVKQKNKCFLDVAGKNIMLRNIEWLKAQGVNEILFALKQNVGTANCLLEFEDLIYSDFIVINGDTIQTMDLNQMYLTHLEQKSKKTVYTHYDLHRNGGVFIFNPQIFTEIRRKNKEKMDLWEVLDDAELYFEKRPYFDCGTVRGLKKARNYFYYNKVV